MLINLNGKSYQVSTEMGKALENLVEENIHDRKVNALYEKLFDDITDLAGEDESWVWVDDLEKVMDNFFEGYRELMLKRIRSKLAE